MVKDKTFEKLVEGYRLLGSDKLGSPNGQWEIYIERNRLEDVEKKLPDVIKLAIEAFFLLKTKEIPSEIKQNGVKTMQKMWEMIQIAKIQPVMKRDLIDWIQLLKAKHSVTLEYRLKDKIQESQWRLERIYRHFNVKPKEDEETPKEIQIKKPDFTHLTYFVQGSIKWLSQEQFEYDSFMTQCEYFLCLLRKLQSEVESMSNCLITGNELMPRKKRCEIYDAIYTARKSMGFDANETIKLLPYVELVLKAFEECFHEYNVPSDKLIENFNNKVLMTYENAQENLKQHHIVKIGLLEEMERLTEWTGQQMRKDFDAPYDFKDPEEVIEFDLLTECVRNEYVNSMA